MNKQARKITIISSCILMLLGMIATPRVTSAEDVTVSGNGSNSSTAVSVSSTQETSSQQTNNSQITNNTHAAANTGNNSVTGNSGNPSTIQTGDANAAVTVDNSANVSTLTADGGCCGTQSAKAVVSGNGNGSVNTINDSSTANTAIAVNQTAAITNNISQKAVTGNNSANSNNSTVVITSGNSTADTEIKNGSINVANVSIPQNTNGPFTIKIAGNGANSVNTATSNENNTEVISVANCALLINNLKTKYITGENAAISNNGNVTITTGNVLAYVNLENGPVNSSTVTVNKKVHQKPVPTPAPSPAPQPGNNVPSSSPSSTSSSSSSGGTSSGPGSITGATANSLPVTGGSYWFFIALIGNILMMLLGGYLRLHSGRSPGYVYAN